MLTEAEIKEIEASANEYASGFLGFPIAHKKDAYIVGATRMAEKKNLEIENLKSVMVAAAEEIQEHWQAHCDKEGYGPANLMHRLEKGIPSSYAYKAGDFAKLQAQLEAAQEELKAAEGVVSTLEIELSRLKDEYRVLQTERNQWYDVFVSTKAELSRVKEVAKHLAEALKGSDRFNDNSKDVTKALTEFANLMNKEK